MKYSIGLDIGIASIGWAVINLENNRIENLGVRLFPSAERPKDGGAINEKRRNARGLRRRLKRKRVRMNKIKELFVKYNLIRKEDTNSLYILSNKDIDTWELRAQGLERELNSREWARVLTSIAKRRGYKSNRKSLEDVDNDCGKINKAISLNRSYMLNMNYRTVGEMFFKDDKYKDAKRNKYGKYNNCIDRVDLENEINILFETQKNFGNPYVSNDFRNEFIQIFNYQKNFMTDELMDKMIGKCTFEHDKPRASKNSFTFEKAMLLQKVNNLSYKIDGEKIYLNDNERKTIVDLAYTNKSGVTYKQIRQKIGLTDNAIFSDLNYFYKPVKDKKTGDFIILTQDEILKKTEDTIFVKLNGYHKIKEAFINANDINNWEFINFNNPKMFDEIAEILTRTKTDVEIIKKFRELGLENNTINELIKVNFTKFGHLSYEALNKIIPYLETGLQYDKACNCVGYNFKNDSETPKYKLPVISKDDIRNPVVYRSVTQTRKVINAIIDMYGSPFEVHIELARELSKNFKDRDKIKKAQEENNKNNLALSNDIKEHFGINAKPFDLLKVKLYHEQNGKSAYSMKDIDYARLFEDGYVEVDHIIPFSRSFDDSYNNKVLVLTKENQDKKNKTPYEYLSGKAIWESFESFVRSTYRNNIKKRENFLVKNFSADKENEWIARNLNDTKYIARFMSNYIKKNLKFENYGENNNRVKVKTIVGAATTALRHYWGIPSKNRNNNDLHHAEDAVIIACATEKFQNRVREYSKQKELYFQNKNGEYVDADTGEIVNVKYKSHDMERPWPEFKEELEARMSINPSYLLKYGNFHNYDNIDVSTIKPIFVSRMPNRKVKGQAHQETIYSKKLESKNLVTHKKQLNQLTKSDIEFIIKNKDYKDIYNSDKELYDDIYLRMKAFGFKAEKAFPDDYVLRKKSKKGMGPIVNSIKVPSIMNAKGVQVQNGKAANGDMVRVDVFQKNSKYYLVPIYVADMVKNTLPKKAIKANKTEAEWIEIDDNYTFLFSLYYNDLVYFQKNDENPIIAYYISTHRGTGAINLLLHDGSANIEGIGVQNLKKFEKYQVDILGNYYKVNNEKRKEVKNNL